MAYYTVPIVDQRIEKAKTMDKDLYNSIRDLVHIVDGNPKCGFALEHLERIGSDKKYPKWETCKRIASALNKFDLPKTAKVVFCDLPSLSPTTRPSAVLIHVPGPPPSTELPPDISAIEVTTIIAVGGVLRQGGFF